MAGSRFPTNLKKSKTVVKTEKTLYLQGPWIFGSRRQMISLSFGVSRVNPRVVAVVVVSTTVEWRHSQVLLILEPEILNFEKILTRVNTRIEQSVEKIDSFLHNSCFVYEKNANIFEVTGGARLLSSDSIFFSIIEDFSCVCKFFFQYFSLIISFPAGLRKWFTPISKNSDNKPVSLKCHFWFLRSYRPFGYHRFSVNFSSTPLTT